MMDSVTEYIEGAGDGQDISLPSQSTLVGVVDEYSGVENGERESEDSS
jgi:hypothetical protein